MFKFKLVELDDHCGSLLTEMFFSFKPKSGL